MEKFVLREIKGLSLAVRNYKKIMDILSLNVENMSQMQILCYLFDNLERDVNQKEIENFVNLRKPTVSGILDTMEKKGIIKRVIDVEDGRKKIIRLTEKYIDNDKQIMSFMREFNDFMVRGISKQKLNTFYEVIDLMKDNLKEEI